MDTSFIEFLMGSQRQMRMIELVASMRVYGDNLGRMIVLVFVCWVCCLPFTSSWKV